MNTRADIISDPDDPYASLLMCADCSRPLRGQNPYIKHCHCDDAEYRRQMGYFWVDCGPNDGIAADGPNFEHAYATAQLAADASNEGVRVLNDGALHIILTNNPDAEGHEFGIVDPEAWQ